MTTIINPLPNNLTNGTTADAPQVDANFAQVVANVNANGAGNGANNDITSLNALTTPIPPIAGGVPTGAIMMYAAITPPSGWLYCDGSAVSRSTYAALFSLIGGVYGNGDGSTTFNLPDMRGRVGAGYDQSNATGRLTGAETGGADASAIANSGGEQGHVLVTGELASHDHTVNDSGHTHTVNDSGHHHGAGVTNSFVVAQTGGGSVAAGASFDFQAIATTATSTTGITNASATTGITTADAGSDSAHNNVQPTLIIGMIIKT